MALIECSECGGTVSDKAATCPHCGAPINIEQSTDSKEIGPYAILQDLEGEWIDIYDNRIEISYKGETRTISYLGLETVDVYEAQDYTRMTFVFNDWSPSYTIVPSQTDDVWRAREHILNCIDPESEASDTFEDVQSGSVFTDSEPEPKREVSVSRGIGIIVAVVVGFFLFTRGRVYFELKPTSVSGGSSLSTSNTASSTSSKSSNTESSLPSKNLTPGTIYSDKGLTINLTDSKLKNHFGDAAFHVNFKNNTGKKIEYVSSDHVYVNGFRMKSDFFGDSITDGNTLETYYVLDSRLLNAIGINVEDYFSIILNFRAKDAAYNEIVDTGNIEILTEVANKEKTYPFQNGPILYSENGIKMNYAGSFIDQATGSGIDGSVVLASAAFPTIVFYVENNSDSEKTITSTEVAVNNKMANAFSSLELDAGEKGFLALVFNNLKSEEIDSVENSNVEVEFSIQDDETYDYIETGSLKFVVS